MKITTPEEFAKFLQNELAIAGEKFNVFSDPATKKEGLFVKKFGRDYKLQYLSKDGDPKRIPQALRSRLSVSLPKVFVGVNTAPVDPIPIDYGRSGETLRRSQTMKSILTSALTSTKEQNESRIKNLHIDPQAVPLPGADKPPGANGKYPGMPVDAGKIRDTLLRDSPLVDMVECLDPAGSGFPPRPGLADVAKIGSHDPAGIPKIVTFVRLNPEPATRTIILSEAPVGDDLRRADAVSLSYKLSLAELDHVKKGTAFTLIPEDAKIAQDAYVHVGDTNRPLSGLASEAHIAKSIDYASAALRDFISKTKTYKLKFKGRFIVSISDARQFSPGLVVDAESGTVKATRDIEEMEHPAAAPGSPAPGEEPKGVMKAVRVVVEAAIKDGDVAIGKGGNAVLLQGNRPLEIVTLEKLQQMMPHEVPGAIAELYQSLGKLGSTAK